ncbi:sulfate adenylyltransferase [Desulfovibrio sp. OttesenSCG-928-I05]|nr:sulfate adenylyltransferase [Desulfovibrio sp. OttesenSCG-928-I05]
MSTLTHTTSPDRFPLPLGGGALRPLLVPEQERAPLLARYSDAPRIPISGRAHGDLLMLGNGGFTPLDGFMGRTDWKMVCENMTLADGTFWPLPVVLDVDDDTPAQVGAHVVLTFADRPVGILEVREIWRLSDEDILFECARVFRGAGKDSEDFERLGPERHPGVQHVMNRKRTCLGGRLTVLDSGSFPDLPPGFVLSPMELRAMARERSWKKIVCLQLRNPPHRSHEYLARIGLEIADALLIHTPVGTLKPGDLPADVRLRAIRALIDNYLPSDRVILAGYPLDMRYAGPREALLHAAFRQNYGVTMQIVGRDHAGVGDFYAPFEAQDIFSRLPDPPAPEKDLLVQPLKIKWPFYCRKCDSMASLNTCPHGMESRVFHSGSLLRKCFTENTLPPEGFIRPEVFDILAEHYRSAPSAERIVLYGAADGSTLN